MSTDMGMSRRRARLRTVAVAVAAPALLGGWLAGCGEQDHGPALVPVGEALRAQPGVDRVDDFHSRPQVSVAESYEAVVHLAWFATAEQACALVHTFTDQVVRIDPDPPLSRLMIRYGDTGTVYPYPWSMDFGAASATAPDALRESCLRFHRLRSLPAGSTTAVQVMGDRTQVRVTVPKSAGLGEKEARAAIGEVLGIDPDDFDAWGRTGIDIRVDLTSPAEDDETTESPSARSR